MAKVNNNFKVGRRNFSVLLESSKRFWSDIFIAQLSNDLFFSGCIDERIYKKQTDIVL